jgi:hypothetical protein
MKTKSMFIGGMLLAAIVPAVAQDNSSAQGSNPAGAVDNISFGQLQKGSFNINGSVGYTATGSSTVSNLNAYSSKADSVSVPNGKSSSYTLSINPNYLIADGLAVGVTLGYTNTTTLEDAQASYNDAYYSWNNISSTFQIGIGATKYFEITRNFYFKCGISGYYNTGLISNSFLNNGYTSSPVVQGAPTQFTSGFQITAQPGLEYFPSRRWGINFNFNNLITYTSSTVNSTSYQITNGEISYSKNVTTNTFNIGAGLTPTLGVRYTF